jgi:hypothetical protein
VHVHTLALDGVFARSPAGPLAFHPRPANKVQEPTKAFRRTARGVPPSARTPSISRRG